MVLGKTTEFEKWLKGLDPKDQALVETRLESFEEGYFPKDDKSVGGKVMETRFYGSWATSLLRENEGSGPGHYSSLRRRKGQQEGSAKRHQKGKGT